MLLTIAPHLQYFKRRKKWEDKLKTKKIDRKFLLGEANFYPLACSAWIYFAYEAIIWPVWFVLLKKLKQSFQMAHVSDSFSM